MSDQVIAALVIAAGAVIGAVIAAYATIRRSAHPGKDDVASPDTSPEIRDDDGVDGESKTEAPGPGSAAQGITIINMLQHSSGPGWAIPIFFVVVAVLAIAAAVLLALEPWADNETVTSTAEPASSISASAPTTSIAPQEQVTPTLRVTIDPVPNDEIPARQSYTLTGTFANLPEDRELHVAGRFQSAPDRFYPQGRVDSAGDTWSLDVCPGGTGHDVGSRIWYSVVAVASPDAANFNRASDADPKIEIRRPDDTPDLAMISPEMTPPVGTGKC